MCQRYMRPSQSTSPSSGLAKRPERALHRRQPPGGGAHDHAREREQQEQRGDVAQQHVLDHVGGEQVVLAEAVERRDERGQQREHRPGERRRLRHARAAAARLAPRVAEAPHVDAGQQRERREHGRVGEPVELRVASSDVTRHARDCGIGAPTGRSPSGRLGRARSSSQRSWRLRSAGAAAAGPRGSPLCRRCARGLRRLAPELVDLAGVPCFAPVAYEGAARELVRALKFRAALGVAGSMAAAIVATAPEGLFAGAALVPVPPTPERERRRGFDQALVLAHALARRTGCTVVACLERGGGGSQVGRGRSERARALAGAVRASGAAHPRMRAPGGRRGHHRCHARGGRPGAPQGRCSESRRSSTRAPWAV